VEAFPQGKSSSTENTQRCAENDIDPREFRTVDDFDRNTISGREVNKCAKNFDW
jgi:hypothetical protein